MHRSTTHQVAEGSRDERIAALEKFHQRGHRVVGDSGDDIISLDPIFLSARQDDHLVGFCQKLFNEVVRKVPGSGNCDSHGSEDVRTLS